MRLRKGGCTDTVRESALRAETGRKIPYRIEESNLPQRCAGPTLYQLSYIPRPFITMTFAIGRVLQIS